MDSLFGPETVVIVTGSSSGIGAATVVKFAQKGVNRFCLTGRNQQGILDTQQKLNSVNPKADCVAVTGRCKSRRKTELLRNLVKSLS